MCPNQVSALYHRFISLQLNKIFILLSSNPISMAAPAGRLLQGLNYNKTPGFVEFRTSVRRRVPPSPFCGDGSLYTRRFRFVNSEFTFCRQQLVSHRVNHRDLNPAVVQGPAHSLDVAVLVQQLHRVDLAKAVRGHILRQPERFGRSLHVFPNCLPGLVLSGHPARKDPDRPGLLPDFGQQARRQAHTPPLPCLGFCNHELQPKLLRP